MHDTRRNPDFEYVEEKKNFSDQCRSCFTMARFEELKEPRAIANFENQLGDIEESPASHFDLFGRFGIGIDSIHGRAMNILPAMYFYKVSGSEESLSTHLLRRLIEIREILKVLSEIEFRYHGQKHFPFPQSDAARLGFTVIDDIEVRQAIERINKYKANRILKPFKVDRLLAWNYVDYLDILISLFQDTDSTLEDSPLSFYEQREWRMVFHHHDDLEWISAEK